MRIITSMPTILHLYHFRYFDPLRSKWVTARYVAEREESVAAARNDDQRIAATCCKEKPRYAGGVLSESFGRLVRFAAARESDTG